MNTGNANLLEIFWTCTGLVGFVIQCWALNDAVATLRWLEARSLNGARHRVAFGNARDETIRTVIQLIFVCIGLVAMATKPANTQHPVTSLSFVVTSGIIATQILLVLKAIFNRRDTLWLIDYLNRKQERGDPNV